MSNPFERRAAEGGFQSLQELITYYRRYLTEPLIEATILEAGSNFVIRTFGTPEQERLQFIRRCESSLEADARKITKDNRRTSAFESSMVPG